MKKDIHPDNYRLVVFKDTSCDYAFLTKSTVETKETIKRAGVPKSVPVTPGDLILSNSATCGVPIFVEVEGCIHDGWLLFRNISKISKGYLYHQGLSLLDYYLEN